MFTIVHLQYYIFYIMIRIISGSMNAPQLREREGERVTRNPWRYLI